MPAQQRTTPLLWPVLVGSAVAAAVAAIAAVVAVSSSGLDGPQPGPPGPLRILVAVPTNDRVVHAVTEEANCRNPLFAEAQVRADVVELRVIGQSPGGGCTAEIKVRCNEVMLPAAAAGKPLLAIPVTDRTGRVSEQTLAREHALGKCPRIQLR